MSYRLAEEIYARMVADAVSTGTTKDLGTGQLQSWANTATAAAHVFEEYQRLRRGERYFYHIGDEDLL